MNSLSKYDSIEDLSINGSVEISRFVKANYYKFTIYQLTTMLGVTPGVIQDILTDEQLRKCGRRAAASVVFIRDIKAFDDDTLRFFPDED